MQKDGERVKKRWKTAGLVGGWDRRKVEVEVEEEEEQNKEEWNKEALDALFNETV